MNTLRHKLSNLNIDNNNEIKSTQRNKNSLLKLSTNFSMKKRKSSFISKKNMLLFTHILSKQNTQETDKEYNNIISLLIKEPNNRTIEENKMIGNYLSNKYYTFRLLKDKDKEKYEIMISIIHLKKYFANNIIINYDSIMDKMYFLLEGKIATYKRIYIKKLMTYEKYLNILSFLKIKEDINKYNRVKEKNEDITSELNYNPNKKYNQYYIEENKKTGIIEEGNNFGGRIEELYEERKNSNLMFKTEEDSLILFFNLDYYKKLLDKVERKKLKQEIENLRNNFILFKYFSELRLIQIYKKLKTQILYKDDYLYHQNDSSKYIYFITQGKFCKYASFSFSWLLDYLNYIKDSTTNIIYHLIKFFPKNQIEHNNLISEIEEKKLKSPMVNEHLSILEKLEEKYYEKYVYGVKLEEENINNNQNIFRIKMENIGIGDTPGIEDGIEFKNRYYSIKCVSDVAEVKKIKIDDFLRIIKIYKNENNDSNNHLLSLIAQKKLFLFHQIIKHAQRLEINLTSNFDTKYDKLIEKNEIEKSNKNKYLSIAAIKAKGYKYDIKEIFDKEIPIFPEIKKSFSDNYFIKNQTLIKKLYENPNKKSKKLLKLKKQSKNNNLILSLSNPNYFIFKENSGKNYLSEENNKSKNKFSFDYDNNNNNFSPKSKSKFNLTLSTNFSFAKSNKKIKKLKTEFFNHKINEEIKNEIIKEEKLKNKEDVKKKNIKCIESSLSNKFINENKKYYLGNHFKKKLDIEKKKFNMIKYKNYFNNK